ncbi:MAG TPA: MFS transporter [Arachidicoccus sp.]|nr:MFS transporter [Arachidicoccus sp.]
MKKSSFTKYQAFLITALAMMQFTIMMDFMIISPLGAHLSRVLHITSAQFGLVVSAYAFSAGISGLITALFADKYDRKQLLLFFYIGFIAGTIFCGMANSYPLLLISRIVTGIFGGVIAAIIYTIITDSFSYSVRGRAVSFVQMAFSVSQVMGIPLGLFLTDRFNWQVPFRVIAAVSIILLLIIIKWMIPVPKTASKSNGESLKQFIKVLRSKAYQPAYFISAILAIGGFLLMPYASIYLINNVGIKESQLPLIYMAAGGCTVIATPLLGILSDKIGKYKIFIAGSLMVIMMIAIYTNLPPSTLITVIIVSCLLYIGVASRMISGMSVITAVPLQQQRGAFMSINASVQQLAGAIASLCGGLITYQKLNGELVNFNILGDLIILLVIASFMLMYRIDRKLVPLEANGKHNVTP